MRLVMGVSDRVVVLNYGRVIAEGPPDAVQAHPDVIRAYLGPGMLTLESVSAGYGRVEALPASASA